MTGSGLTSTGVPKDIRVNNAGEVSLDILSGERDRGTSNAHFQSIPKWTAYKFNPRAASIGTAVGTAGAVGTTEVLIGGGVPMIYGGWLPEVDSAVGSIFLRDAVAVNTSAAYHSVDVKEINVGYTFQNGLCVVGTALGVSGVILARPAGANS